MLRYTWIVLVLFGGVRSYLVDRPRNTVAIVGQAVTLTCRTNATVDRIAWQFSDAFGDPQSPVYHYRLGLNPAVRDRGIDVDKYDLVFSNVTMVDAGTYTCQEEGVHARAAWITVLEAEPRCWNETVTDETNETDDVRVILLCNVTYNGSLGHQPDTNRLVPRTNWTCDADVELLNKSTSDDMVSEDLPTLRTLTTSVQLGFFDESTRACHLSLYFETVTTDQNINGMHPDYRFQWTYGTKVSTPEPSATPAPSKNTGRTVGLVLFFLAIVGVIASSCVAWRCDSRRPRPTYWSWIWNLVKSTTSSCGPPPKPKTPEENTLKNSGAAYEKTQTKTSNEHEYCTVTTGTE